MPGGVARLSIRRCCCFPCVAGVTIGVPLDVPAHRQEGFAFGRSSMRFEGCPRPAIATSLSSIGTAAALIGAPADARGRPRCDESCESVQQNLPDDPVQRNFREGIKLRANGIGRMRHTFEVHKFLQPVALVAAFAIFSLPCSARDASAWQEGVRTAALISPEARIVVLDVSTGQLLAEHRLGEAAHTLAAPGSTLKPLVLYSLIATGHWDPQQRIACNRRLSVAGHRLACPHPPAPPFDAREALTWSCNSYFAALARNLAPGELAGILRSTGLLEVTGLAANEAAADFREPRIVDDAQLTLLGVEGIRVSPLELAEAYRWLALQMAAHPDSQATQVVRDGLLDSTSFGMAGEASLGGLSVAGKTGTAEGVASARTHGWFSGLAPAAHPRVVIVVFEPAGRGADAAHLAGELLAHAPGEERR